MRLGEGILVCRRDLGDETCQEPPRPHWHVPDEDQAQHGHLVWACVPEALAAWHVRNADSQPDVNDGAKRVNHRSLGIEVVNAQANVPFSDWQIEATARIDRHCWSKHPNLVHVVAHAKLDPKRRSDPGSAFDWPRFQSLVLHGTNDEVSALVASATPAQKIRITSANCRCEG
jgi:N-acetyl-anhydromuramyl-L-alanine amidase AmpD